MYNLNVVTNETAEAPASTFSIPIKDCKEALNEFCKMVIQKADFYTVCKGKCFISLVNPNCLIWKEIIIEGIK